MKVWREFRDHPPNELDGHDGRHPAEEQSNVIEVAQSPFAWTEIARAIPDDVNAAPTPPMGTGGQCRKSTQEQQAKFEQALEKQTALSEKRMEQALRDQQTAFEHRFDSLTQSMDLLKEMTEERLNKNLTDELRSSIVSTTKSLLSDPNPNELQEALANPLVAEVTNISERLAQLWTQREENVDSHVTLTDYASDQQDRLRQRNNLAKTVGTLIDEVDLLHEQYGTLAADMDRVRETLDHDAFRNFSWLYRDD